MSPKLPVVRPRELIKTLEKAGFYRMSQKGSHVGMRHPDGRATTVPFHTKDLPKGLLHKILKQTKISPGTLEKLL